MGGFLLWLGWWDLLWFCDLIVYFCFGWMFSRLRCGFLLRGVFVIFGSCYWLRFVMSCVSLVLGRSWNCCMCSFWSCCCCVGFLGMEMCLGSVCWGVSVVWVILCIVWWFGVCGVWVILLFGRVVVMMVVFWVVLGRWRVLVLSWRMGCCFVLRWLWCGMCCMWCLLLCLFGKWLVLWWELGWFVVFCCLGLVGCRSLFFMSRNLWCCGFWWELWCVCFCMLFCRCVILWVFVFVLVFWCW